MEKVFTAFEWCFTAKGWEGVTMWEEGLIGNAYLIAGASLNEIEGIAKGCKTQDEFETILDERFDIWED